MPLRVVEIVGQRAGLRHPEKFRPVEQRAVDAARIRALHVDEAVARFRDLVARDEIREHAVVLDLGEAQQGVPAAVLLRHRADHRSDVGELLLILVGRPGVLPLRGEGLVVLAAVVLRVKEILHVVEADHISVVRDDGRAACQQQGCTKDQEKSLHTPSCSTTTPRRRDSAPPRSSACRRED